MGFLKNMFKQLESEVTKAMTESQQEEAKTRPSGAPPTRWERAVVSLDKVVVQLVKVDPDGVDIVCFGGDDTPDWYRNVKSTKGLEQMVNDKTPEGVSHSI